MGRKTFFLKQLSSFCGVHDFWYACFKFTFMQSKSSTSTVLIVLLIVFTFPLWLGLAGGLFGLIVGLLGAAFGIIAGVFGAVFGAIGGIFGWFFDWPFNGFFRWNIFSVILIAVIIALVARSKRV